MKNDGMIDEVVLSPIKDDKINIHINESPIWKNAYHPDEVTQEIKNKYPAWFSYSIKFSGTRPIQLTKFKAI